MPFPHFLNLIETFKQECEKRGWKTFEKEDLINAEGKYHYLLWTRKIYPYTFKKIVENPYQTIRVNKFYKKIKVSFLAWISEKPIPEEVKATLFSNPDLPKKVALYDTSEVHKKNHICLKTNLTMSPVFLSFEKLLEKNGVRFKKISRVSQIIK
jgi:hypothetical protein